MNADKLRGRIIEAGMTIEMMADKLGINASTLSRKLKGTTEFTRKEIRAIRDLLGLDSDDVDSIFFTD